MSAPVVVRLAVLVVLTAVSAAEMIQCNGNRYIIGRAEPIDRCDL